jgi:hypothetical protein
MPSKIRDTTVIEELKRLSKIHGGLLSPEVVVREAAAEKSPLHDYFTWDDDEAAQRWRIHEARRLINVCVEIIDDGNKNKEVNVFVSLKSDREEGGYRTMVNVLSNASLRSELVSNALDEMEFFREKYKTLRELASVFAVMKKVEAKLRKK